MSQGVKTPSYRQRLGYHSGLLGGMGLLASMVLVIADVETRQAITHAKLADQKASLVQVLPDDMHDNALLEDTLEIALNPAAEESEYKKVFIARQGDTVTGAAYQMGDYGYSGLINIIMGVDPQGEILGVRVLSHTETPGLGDKIEVTKDDWILQFSGLSLENPPVSAWKVEKDGGEFDQFTGATITPRTVVKLVKEGLMFFATHRVEILAYQPPPELENEETEASQAIETSTTEIVPQANFIQQYQVVEHPTWSEAVHYEK